MADIKVDTPLGKTVEDIRGKAWCLGPHEDDILGLCVGGGKGE